MPTSSLSVPAGFIPCGATGSSKQVDVVTGHTVNITFTGTPPYNISRFVLSRINGTDSATSTFCDLVANNYSSNTYVFTFDPYPWYSGSSNGTEEYIQTIQLPGDAVTLAAIELTSSMQNAFTLSSNYTIVKATTSAASTTRNGSKVGILVTALLVLNML